MTSNDSFQGELEADSYQRLKAHTLGQIDKLNIQISDLEISDTAFQKYTRYGMSLLKDLTLYFQEAGLEAKRKLLGSIFPAKLTFQNGKYRTNGLNSALAIILQKIKNLENEKWGDIVISENVSGDVPMTGIEPAPCCQEQILSLPRLPIPPHRPETRENVAIKKIFFKELGIFFFLKIPIRKIYGLMNFDRDLMVNFMNKIAICLS